MKLGSAIAAQDATLADASPIESLDWAVSAAGEGDLAEALRLHAEAETHAAAADAAYQKRNVKLKNVLSLIRRSRDILKGHHADELKVLGDYGFQVDDTPRTRPGTPEAEAA